MTVKEPGKRIYSESVGDVHICKEAVPLDKIKKRDMKLSDYNISRAKYNTPKKRENFKKDTA